MDLKPTRGERWVVRLLTVGVLLALGCARIATDAEFVFVSLSLLPVLLGAWVLGLSEGLSLATLAASMWLLGDAASNRPRSDVWVYAVNGLTHLLTYSAAVLLATRLHRRFERAHEHAFRDELTGLYNRRAFFELGEQLVDGAKRSARSMAIIFVDLDNFKAINDRDGHSAGDEALRMAANALSHGARDTDLLARLGGDEFVFLLSDVDAADATRAGERLMRSARLALGRFPGLSASVGIAWFEVVNLPLEELLAAADELMLDAKRGGKDALVFRAFGGTDGAPVTAH
ncbi:GGDEF domain-containing protein [Roseateles sp.]|uniref:GGDEF domain-containing protein n=1 Tax=Roseateles sp. TaxID=1971397 RepID=UPI002E096AF8|nr:GGDEF domain-containing protein [Roseateles sp.]